MKLSVITINYNNYNGLLNTLNSISSQTFKEFEWIVIDGGSTDGSKELLEKNRKHISYWISEHDEGIYNAMNKGIIASKGEYLLFLNSGDYLYNNEVLDLFNSYMGNEDIIYGDVLYETKTDPIRIQSLNKNNITICDMWIHSLPHQASFIKRMAFDKFGMYNENLKVSADWFFFIRSIVVGGASYKYLASPISIMQSGGISSNRIYGDEIIELKKIIPERILCEIPKAVSLSEVQRIPLCYFLYKCIYKLAILIKKLHK